ncbi:carbohydrate ABC transporter permease [Virgibacillus sp. LDC1]|uniref:Carbohydrate ABC transporter permease n=1 Tax=Paenibacillus lautus TaxID=1401 RepID=A0A2A5LJV8_PAELA|nr:MULTISPECIES: carbohydrate ABC transporter permease [Paenibacillus]MBY0164427.1 carbohydrate ABC transporter permease [Cytobacillus firmus]MCV4233991.1 carbohydrate ABC transporter permease [Virgibacillus sp. LDC1]VTR57638.1 maltose transporter permease [Actinobacillus pleuropneumoniae]ACX62819.1 binding-protein-dependent transport systems inner membrane component [Paenibacillus sp. Y412MC10]AYB46727.1 carbohydrate ABC transporter permease [Paenibacillus lautus]
MVNNKRFSLRNISLFGIINTLILTCLAIITVYPVVYITAVSLSATSEVVQGNITLFPKGFNLDAYAQVLNDDRVPRAYLNTIFYTALGTAINLLLTAVAAYPLARKNFFGRKFFLLAIIMTMFLNPGIIPNYLIVSELGLLDSVWALVLPNAIWTFELLILKSFYENMSESLREAAVVDGASEYRILFQIVLPLSKPALASIGLFYFMGHWNSFFIPLIYLNDANMYPLQVVLRDMLIFSENGSNPSLVDASALAPQAMKNATIVLSMIPVLLIYPFAQKYFAKGVMLGSEKG